MGNFNTMCDAALDELNRNGELRHTDKLVATRLIDDGYANAIERPFGKRESWHLLAPTHKGVAFAEDGGYKWLRMQERWKFWTSKYGMMISASGIVINIAWSIYNSLFRCH